MSKGFGATTSRSRGAPRGAAALKLDPVIGARSAARTCDVPGCGLAAEHRAPKSPHQLNDYYWFCLDHVRDYNKAWNFYDGMSDDEVEDSIRRATTWERPSWPFGTRRNAGRTFAGGAFKDDFGVFEDEEAEAEARGRAAPPGRQSEEAQAFAIMGLTPPVTLDELKAQYKRLVKINHPDRNGGDKDAEERLKLINDAYTTLKRFVT